MEADAQHRHGFFRSNTMIRQLVTATFCLLPFLLLAQGPMELLERNKVLWPESDAIFLETKRIVTISFEGDSIKTVSEEWEERLILNQQGSVYAQESVTHSDFFKLRELKASSFAPTKKGFKETSVEEFKTKDKLGGSVFHDDSKETSFLYPGMIEGGKTKMYQRSEILDVRFLNSYFFLNYLPVNKMVYEIRFPENMDIYVQEMNMEDLDFTFSESKADGQIIYRWEADSVPVLKLESSAPDIRYYCPHLLPRVRFYEQDGKRVQVLEDVSDLYYWYSEWIDTLNQEDDPTIKAIVDSIITDEMSDMEKVQTIYSWVQDHIKYIAIEAGYGGFIPREASLVCERRFGDCKDMTSILTNMIHQAGIEEAYPVWIGTRDIPYTYNQNPAPNTDNHMVAVYMPEGEDPILLDATGEHLPFGYPSGFIQGKEGMVGIVPFEEFKIIEIPIMTAEQNGIFDTVEVELDGATLTGVGNQKTTGYFRSTWVARMSDRTGTNLNKFLRAQLEKGSNNFILGETQLPEKSAWKGPFKFSYDFEIPNYAIDLDEEIFINLYLEQPFKNDSWEEDRTLPVSLRHTSRRNFVVKMKIPEGYGIQSMPEEFQAHNELFDFSAVHSEKEGYVICSLDIKMKKIYVEVEEIEELNKVYKELAAAYAEVVVLEKIN